MFLISKLSSNREKLCFVAIAILLLMDSCFAQPAITLSKSSGPPTTKLLVSGIGFAPNVGVDIYFDTTDETLVITDTNGSFHDAAAHALASSYPGKHWVTALQRYGGQGAQNPFLVFTNWSQFHFDTSRTGLNPYENVISKRTASRLRPTWSATGIDESFASPTVADGLFYAASQQGELYTFNAFSGKLVWSQYAGGCSLEGSPAVAAGIVYDQDLCGFVYAWNARTGSLIWKEQLSNTGSSSPAASNGVIFISAANSQKAVTTLYALNAKTGATIWTAPIGGYNGDASPTPSLGADAVYAITEGQLFALDAHTGNQLWTYTVGHGRGAYAAPCVANGVVYASSVDGNVYALNATTGTLIWKYATADQVSSTPAFANGLIYVGSTDNNLYALNAYSGALQWEYATGGAIYSSPAVANGVVFDSSGDYNLYAWDADTGALLWQYAVTDSLFAPSPAVANGSVWLGGDNVHAFTVAAGDVPGSSASDVAPDMGTLRPSGEF